MTLQETIETPALLRAWYMLIIPYFDEPYLSAASGLLCQLDREGKCVSSVIESSDPNDPDGWLKPDAFEALKQVTLTEHIALVIEEAAKIIPPTSLLLYRLLIIAALGSDISKTRDGQSSRNNHPLKSCIMTREILVGQISPPEVEAITLSIRTHHVDVVAEGRLCAALRLAHMRARAIELERIDLDLNTLAKSWDTIPILPLQVDHDSSMIWGAHPTGGARLDCSEVDLGWLNIDSFLLELAEIIDRCPPGDFAISRRRGDIYFVPHTLYRVFRRFAIKAGWRKTLLYDGDPFERRRLLRRLILELYAAGALLGNFPEVGYFYLVHIISYGPGNYRERPLIPFTFSVFPDDVLKRGSIKPGWLAKVKRIWPLGEKGTSRLVFDLKETTAEDL